MAVGCKWETGNLTYLHKWERLETFHSLTIISSILYCSLYGAKKRQDTLYKHPPVLQETCIFLNFRESLATFVYRITHSVYRDINCMSIIFPLCDFYTLCTHSESKSVDPLLCSSNLTLQHTHYMVFPTCITFQKGWPQNKTMQITLVLNRNATVQGEEERHERPWHCSSSSRGCSARLQSPLLGLGRRKQA